VGDPLLVDAKKLPATRPLTVATRPMRPDARFQLMAPTQEPAAPVVEADIGATAKTSTLEKRTVTTTCFQRTECLLPGDDTTSPMSAIPQRRSITCLPGKTPALVPSKSMFVQVAVPSSAAKEWQVLYERLTAKLGDLDLYSFVFDPYEEPTTPIVGSLANDIADIYRDLADGFAAVEAGGTTEDGLWEWRFGFASHWRRHAAHALYAVYVLTHPGGAQWVGLDP
jgi:hypothetical protein